MEDVNFREVPPFLFGESFDTLAKEMVEAAVALTKTLGLVKSRESFQKSCPQRNWAAGVTPSTVAIATSREDDKQS